MPKSCLIIGAGLSGLIAANLLQQAGITAIVLEKARGVGGRMATRRFANSIADHGAQYFTARDPRFVDYVRVWQRASVAQVWSQGFLTADGELKTNNEARYIGAAGMTTIPKHLAQSVDVKLERRVVHIEVVDQVWHVTTDNGAVFSGNALLLTPPLPQSLALLDKSQISLIPNIRTALDQITYHACFAVMAQLAGPSRIAAPGGVWLNGEPLRWIADNYRKGISPDSHSITIHAGPEFTQTHWDMDWNAVAQLMLDAAADWIGMEITAIEIQRWRYSKPQNGYPEPCVSMPAPAPFVLAGDAFAGARVEGAALSGIAAAEWLIDMMQ